MRWRGRAACVAAALLLSGCAGPTSKAACGEQDEVQLEVVLWYKDEANTTEVLMKRDRVTNVLVNAASGFIKQCPLRDGVDIGKCPTHQVDPGSGRNPTGVCEAKSVAAEIDRAVQGAGVKSWLGLQHTSNRGRLEMKATESGEDQEGKPKEPKEGTAFESVVTKRGKTVKRKGQYWAVELTGTERSAWANTHKASGLVWMPCAKITTLPMGNHEELVAAAVPGCRRGGQVTGTKAGTFFQSVLENAATNTAAPGVASLVTLEDALEDGARREPASSRQVSWKVALAADARPVRLLDEEPPVQGLPAVEAPKSEAGAARTPPAWALAH